jgi:hypothetical protein
MSNGLPLFNKTEYPLVSVIDALLKMPASVSANFNVLIWADDKNRIVTEPHGRTTIEREVGYSTKEEAFINELCERGNRWRYEKVSDHSDLTAKLQKQQFAVLVIIGEDLRALVLKAAHYLDRIPYGPKTVILGFHKRDLNSSYLYGVWSYLKSRGRLHLLRNLAMANRGGGLIFIGIKDNDGRPLLPIRTGLQNVSKSDRELCRLGQMKSSAFGVTGPEISMGAVQILQKYILFIKVFGNVGTPVRPPTSKPGDDKYPFRDNQMTAWHAID